jgi:hypothetical protein
VFDNTKPDADISKVARLAISDMQQHSQVHAFFVEGHADKRAPPPFSPQEELNIFMDALAAKAQTLLPPEMRPRSDFLRFPDQQISIFIQRKKKIHASTHISHCQRHPRSYTHQLPLLKIKIDAAGLQLHWLGLL